MKPNNLRSVFERIKRNHNGCWIWQGNTLKNGYGMIRVHGKYQLAHRVAWMFMNGEIPADKQIDHVCTVKNCVNPEHLDLVTASENLRRGFQRNALCKNGHLKPYKATFCILCLDAKRKRNYRSYRNTIYQRRYRKRLKDRRALGAIAKEDNE